MAGPWEKFKPAVDSSTDGPWAKFEKPKEPTSSGNATEAAVRGLSQGVSLGFADEMQGGLEAFGQALGIKGLGANDFSSQEFQKPKWSAAELREAYINARDAVRSRDAKVRETNPGTFGASEVVGTIGTAMVPGLAAAKGLGSAVRAGAKIGAAQGLGTSEAESAGELIEDTAKGAAFGSAGGAIGRGAERVVTAAGPAIRSAGKRLGAAAENLAFKSSGAMLKDYRTSDVRGLGRWILDNAGLKAFDSVDDVAKKASSAKSAAGAKLDKVYGEAVEKFGQQLQQRGFNPITDKEAILQSVRNELGDAVGADAAVQKVASYLDEVAERNVRTLQQAGRPSDARRPLDPRATNRIKSAIDDQINYSRNPLSKEPATEAAFSAARKEISKLVDEGIEAAGGDKLLGQLKAANREYGKAVSVSRIAKDRLSRENANKYFGLTDTIAGGAGLAYGGATGDWETAVAAVAGKKAIEKWGTSTLAVAADRVSKQLLKSPSAAAIAKSNPQAFRATVINLSRQMLEGTSGAAKSVAGTEALRGRNKWASDGYDRVEKALGAGAIGVTREQVLADNQLRDYFIQASNLDPKSKAFQRVVDKIKARVQPSELDQDSSVPAWYRKEDYE